MHRPQRGHGPEPMPCGIASAMASAHRAERTTPCTHVPAESASAT